MALNDCQMIFHPGNCLNTKKPYPKQCRQCLLYCPHEAITEDMQIKKGKCTECGVCMSVCPSDGFVDKEMDSLRDYIFNKDKVILNCPQAQARGYEIACIGMLDEEAWLTLMILAQKKDIRILTGDCGKCDDRQACVVSVTSLKKINAQWPEHPQIKIEIAPSDGEDNEEEEESSAANKDTRTASGWREQGKEKVKSLLPSIVGEETYLIPRTRQWLAEALKLYPDFKIQYEAVKVDDKCTNCGVCVKICPQDALQLVQREGKIRLIYQADRCVHCKRCVEICGPQAMTLEPISFSHKLLTGKILVRESIPRYCSKCGKQIFHNIEPRLCMQCASKDPELKGILY